MAFPMIALALSLLSPAAHSHVCSPMTDSTTIGEIRACMGAQPSPVSPPVVPPVVQPAPSNEACEAYGDDLAKARAAFAFQCPGRQRRDCDPISGGWMCSTDVIGSAAPTSSAPAPITPPAVAGRSSSSSDLLILAYDSNPDQDDHQAMLVGKAIVDTLGLDPLVVIGAYGEHGGITPAGFIPGSVRFWRSVYPSAIDAHTQRDQSVQRLAEEIIGAIASGRQARIADGGPHDLTARVIRMIQATSPATSLKRLHVYQHSAGNGAFNWDKTRPENLQLVRTVPTYHAIPNGNVGGNGSADFQEPASSAMCQRHMQRMLAGPYSTQWQRAFGLIENARKCDASDAVELLAIVGDAQTRTFDDFYSRYVAE